MGVRGRGVRWHPRVHCQKSPALSVFIDIEASPRTVLVYKASKGPEPETECHILVWLLGEMDVCLNTCALFRGNWF